MSSPQDPAERFVLPDSFASPGDPVEGNPFPIDDPRHQVWIGATRTAEEAVCHFNSRALLNLTPGPAQDWPATIVIAKFDAWAQRGASVVWSDRALQHYDQWHDRRARWHTTHSLAFTDRRAYHYSLERFAGLRRRLDDSDSGSGLRG